MLFVLPLFFVLSLPFLLSLFHGFAFTGLDISLHLPSQIGLSRCQDVQDCPRGQCYQRARPLRGLHPPEHPRPSPNRNLYLTLGLYHPSPSPGCTTYALLISEAMPPGLAIMCQYYWTLEINYQSSQDIRHDWLDPH
jgi:hypothetical protein